jgi:hypothetical protein
VWCEWDGVQFFEGHGQDGAQVEEAQHCPMLF